MKAKTESPSLFDRWHNTPLYVRILAGCVLGVLIGTVISVITPLTLSSDPERILRPEHLTAPLEIPSRLVLQLLAALAPPLVLLAVVQALMHAQLPKGSATKLVKLLLLNTLVAIFIGLLVANTLQPGRWFAIDLRTTEEKQLDEKKSAVSEEKATEKNVEAKKTEIKKIEFNPVEQVLSNVPKSLLGPLSDKGSVIAVILMAIAFGLVFRQLKDEKIGTVAQLVEVAFKALLIMLHWIIEVIPFAVLGIVASIIGKDGFTAFASLGGFVVAVLLALALQTTYYLVRIRYASWVNPMDALRGMRDALVMAFSTGSSTATMPLTYKSLREKVGVREQSASLGALVGANFNNDGTALYEAMAALFISQCLGRQLELSEQLMVVITSVIASVGAAGIPEAGLVTMTLVFTAVGLKPEYVGILLTVDWFLDRCRTAVNVMGDVNVSCVLDGKEREIVKSVPKPSEMTEAAPTASENLQD